MAPAQPTFSELEANSGCVTRRRRFLALLDPKIPWSAWAARVEPHCPKAGGGHTPMFCQIEVRGLHEARIVGERAQGAQPHGGGRRADVPASVSPRQNGSTFTLPKSPV